ncbi:helix-turn-helix transcriptional regulator [Acholeplasma equirhinis]|uniref:helix-turn-helix domain-containing protein n=1 Tax=Acholeplasma equirhinis TaxID=555393 RepID=UPI00197B0375|nr:helix-turn-helix transcriptional regulator [Acholeplasma equirhinis]MBN3489954.1 helix-turn-helix transcriptional regulator [Acholeplasma equirhinis]
MKKDYKIENVIKQIEDKNETLQIWRKQYESQKKIIDKIISVRKSKGITQKQLAEMTGLKQSAIARIESFSNSPQLDTLVKISFALDLKIELLDHTQEIYNVLKFDNLKIDIEDHFIEYIRNIFINKLSNEIKHTKNIEISTKEVNNENTYHTDSSRQTYLA